MGLGVEPSSEERGEVLGDRGDGVLFQETLGPVGEESGVYGLDSTYDLARGRHFLVVQAGLETH